MFIEIACVLSHNYTESVDFWKKNYTIYNSFVTNYKLNDVCCINSIFLKILLISFAEIIFVESSIILKSVSRV